METRELEYFVAVAEELHFGRAARRLGIAQPPLSRAIRQLERRLGAVLLERTSRAVTLTPAGAVLLREGRAALAAVAAAEQRTRRAARPDPRLTLVTKAGAAADLLPALLSAYAAEPEAVAVDVQLCGIGEQARYLRDGRADVGLLHLPYDDLSGLDHEELFAEGCVAVLPLGHRLAARESLRMADLAGEPLPRWSDDEPGDAPIVRDGAQLFQLISLGIIVAVLPEASRVDLRRDLVAVPVLDGPAVTTVIAWPPQTRSRAVAALVRAAARLTRPAGVP